MEARNQVLLVDADSSGGVAVSNSISLEVCSEVLGCALVGITEKS